MPRILNRLELYPPNKKWAQLFCRALPRRQEDAHTKSDEKLKSGPNPIQPQRRR